MHRRALGAGLAAAGLALSIPGARAQSTIRLTVSTGHPATFLWVSLLRDHFIPEVDRRIGTRSRIEWTQAFGTVARLGAESDAIRQGISDLGNVSTVFEAAKFPLHNVTYAAPFAASDNGVVTAAIREVSKRVPQMAQEWTRNNLVDLGGSALDDYHLFTNFPIRSLEDLRGRKIAAPGPSANWLKGTGAVPVAGTLSTYYNDIRSGVYDGALTFITGGRAARLYEVAPHVTLASYGAQFANGIAVNRDVLNRLPAEVRQAIREAGESYTRTFAEEMSRRVASDLEAIRQAGGQVHELPAAERARWAQALPNIAEEWAQALAGRGLPARQVMNTYMAVLKELGAQPARDWTLA